MQFSHTNSQTSEGTFCRVKVHLNLYIYIYIYVIQLHKKGSINDAEKLQKDYFVEHIR